MLQTLRPKSVDVASKCRLILCLSSATSKNQGLKCTSFQKRHIYVPRHKLVQLSMIFDVFDTVPPCFTGLSIFLFQFFAPRIPEYNIRGSLLLAFTSLRQIA
ncbi:hypothetical protein E4T56_gene8385 [Termitomyces sp. T112]|nr:hypothetical protein E4T56_gene8385 [Termitomyces sp. T112]